MTPGGGGSQVNSPSSRRLRVPFTQCREVCILLFRNSYYFSPLTLQFPWYISRGLRCLDNIANILLFSPDHLNLDLLYILARSSIALLPHALLVF